MPGNSSAQGAIPSVTLAAVFDRYGSADVLDVREIRLPSDAPVLVEVTASSVNPKDTFVRKGRFRQVTGKRFPMPSGYDFSGTVVRSRDPNWASGTPVFGTINGWRGGAAAHCVSCRPDELSRAPRTISLETAAAFPLAALTALQALRDHLRLQGGQRVLINGASGGVGSFAVQIAKAWGAHVTAVASATSAQRCRDLGADDVFDYSNALSTGSGLHDGVFDVFGNLSAKQAKELLTRSGRYVTTIPSIANVSAMLLGPFLPSLPRSSIVNVQSNREDLSALASLVDGGKLSADIEARFPLDRIGDAHRHVERKHTRGKVLVVMGRM